MRICTRYLKSRTGQCAFRLSAVQYKLPISRHYITPRRTYRFPTGVSVRRTFGSRPIQSREVQSARWETLTPSDEAGEAWVEKKGSSGVDDDKKTDDDNLRPPQAELQDPDSWLLLLERFIPARSTEPSLKPPTYSGGSSKRCADILALLVSSRTHSGTDLLAHLGFRQGRWQAALDLVYVLLYNVAAKVPAESANMHLPGLSWPRLPSLDELCSAPIYIEQMETTSKEETALWHHHSLDPRYLEVMSKHQDGTMTEIWKSLGYTIVEAADLEGEEADAAMRFVYRAIAQIHKLGLVPDNVYAYVPSNYTSSVVRPPVMHLLSSRILTTLSDAVWRAHQDDVIAQARSSGIGYKDLSHDPPGGRFRLKVRPLGPEVWLEFVLWCCVDGGFAKAGTKIVEHLQRRTPNPWFAVNWMLPSAYSSTASTTQSATVDWGRVKLRTGGAVGRVEGYSTEQPFAVMDSHTVSTEVVLALVDSLSSSINVGVVNRGSSLRKAIRSIKSLVGFLEPHRLPSGYFDHLAVRLHQSGGCDPDRQPDDVQALAETFLSLQSLENAKEPLPVAVSLGLEAIAAHSELVNGLFHQSLEAFVNQGDIRRALDVFATTQQLVDSSKLRSIGMFLSHPSQQPQIHCTSKTASVDKDFVVSHGQLPLYKLAAFLDLVADSRLVRLGHWLLYSDDVDGPLIPESCYARHCMSPALLHFAAVSKDQELTKRVFNASNNRPLSPSVKFFRALVNTNVTFSRYKLVQKVLRALTQAKAGGFEPGNLATLAAGILSLETRASGKRRSVAQAQFQEAQILMYNLLKGVYNGNPAAYRGSLQALFQRQLGSLLRIFECIPHTSLSNTARLWRSQFDSGNDTSLYVGDFNILFAAIVETKGAAVGRTIWELFCHDPREKFGRNRVDSGSYLIPGWIEDEENEWDYGYFLREKGDLPEARDSHRLIPIVESDEQPVDQVDTAADEARASGASGEETGEQEAVPVAHERIRFDSSGILDDKRGHLERTTSEIEPIDWSLGPETAFDPVVNPNLRTLRFLVRGALNEYRTRQSHGEDTSEQEDILEWSKQFFRAFGVRGKAIQQEVQILADSEDLSEHARPSLAEEKRLYDTARRKLRWREPRPVNISSFFMSGKPGYGVIRPSQKKKAFRIVSIDPEGAEHPTKGNDCALAALDHGAGGKDRQQHEGRLEPGQRILSH